MFPKIQLKSTDRNEWSMKMWPKIALAGSVFAGLLLSFCAVMLFMWKPNTQTPGPLVDQTAQIAEPKLLTGRLASSRAFPLAATKSKPNTFKLGKGQHLAAFLSQHGWTSQEAKSALDTAKNEINLKRLRAGMSIQVIPEKKGQKKIVLQLKPEKDYELAIDTSSLKPTTQMIEYPITKKKLHYRGLVRLSLWESAKQAGMPPAMIDQLADVFAWQIDFAKEVRSGDRWKISVERHYVRGKVVGHGPILAAQFESDHKKLTAVRYPQSGEDARYYFPDGRSLESLFLKSPLRYRRISSRFARSRFHPVLKRRRPHLGVDYAAAPGTRVKSVGDGKVVYAKWRGGGGRVVKIKHNSTYSTAYMHLRGYAKGIKSGARVKQGQVIGYVGSSGLASGPHLHFSFYENGKYINPLGKKFPSANPIPKHKMADFLQTKVAAMQHLSVNTF